MSIFYFVSTIYCVGENINHNGIIMIITFYINIILKQK